MLERRAAAGTDAEFLRALYVSTRPDLAAWDDQARETFVEVQLRAREQGWGAVFPSSTDELILRDGEAVGRIRVAWLPDECRVVDIALLPEHRRAGIGTSVVAELIAEADRRDVPVRLTVERLNSAARAFWSGLGFLPVAEDAIFLELERPVSPAHQQQADG
jgi:ribosomal protein S18 acetylase RimI-like enzyme